MVQNDPFSDPQLQHYYGGALLSPADPRDFQLPHLALRGTQARTNHDLRDYQGQSLMVPIRDQGAVGACTGFAWSRMRAAAAARYHIDRGERPDLGDDISPRFIYDLERSTFLKQYPADSGADMRNGGQVLAQYGVAPERYCPYTGKADNGPIAQDITPEAYQAALDYGVTTYYSLAGAGTSTMIDSILGCLDEGWPCVIAVLVPPSMEQPDGHGRVVTPRASDQVLGGHALCVCGNFIDNSFDGGGCFVIANSWGTGFGDGGYFYMPFGWATAKSSQYGSWLAEGWTIR